MKTVKTVKKVTLATAAFLALGAPNCGDMSEEKKACYEKVRSAYDRCLENCAWREDKAVCKGSCGVVGSADKQDCDRMD